MRFGVLGPVTAWTDAGDPVAIPGLKVRALLADLLAHEGRVVSADRLVEDLWGDDQPGNPSAALQVRVSQLRKALEDAEPGARHLVVSRAPGYALEAAPDAVDAARFARLVAEDMLAEALELWRGAAYADFADFEFLGPVIARLEEARLAAVEELSEVRLAAGEPVDVAALVADHPLRERLRAVHMKALYRAGRQSEALAGYGELRERLADELGLDPSPELAELYQRILRQDPELSARAGRAPTNLPAAVGALIGRDEAVAEVRSLVGESRLVTLTGSGGVGKTSLALEVARRVAGEQPDGAWLVELAAYDRHTPSLAEAVLAAMDIREDAAGARERLVEALRERRLLLVLDNCEHVVDQAAKLAEVLLRAAPGLRILATSREPLNVAGEALWAVPALDLPAGSELINVAKADAVRLFMARATASARGFSLDAGNAEAVAQLVRRLDGIPLALELAATRVRALGVRELVARLDDRFRLLAGFQRGAPARQQTLVAMIDWSWTLLTDQERVVLRRLAVQADGCTLEAAEAICAQDGIDVMDVLARLVDRSLVAVVDGRHGVRYRLLESVAAYCADRLEDAGETTRVRQAHVRYYVALAVEAETFLRGPEQGRWLRRLDAEAANLRVALEHGAAGDAARLVNALGWYWFLRGRLAEARRSLEAALAKPPTGDPTGDPTAEAADRAVAGAWRAGFALMLGLGAEAGWETAVAAVGEPGARARAELFVGFGLPDMASAQAVVERALETFREVGDRWGIAVALSRQARDHFTLREAEALERVGGESERIFAELGDEWGRLQATEWLGGLAEMLGDYPAATRLFGDGLRQAEELGLWPDAVRRLCWLGWMAMLVGDYDLAMEQSGKALRLAIGQGYAEGQVFARMGVGFSARRAGRLDEAVEHLGRMLDGAVRIDADGRLAGGDEVALFLPSALVELGYVHAARDEPEEAATVFREAFAAACRIGDPRTTASTVEALALVAEPQEAARLLGLAAAARAALGTPLSDAEQADLHRATSRARDALGPEAFAAAYATGETQDYDAVL
ncbi:winged helix-turn-helix domain-containing protein [Nonomuraea sp. NBC_01738]|uniref:BTAD domain-containing putative transcriptional regulator n=1 Tax=Nonomuraea sp. NBC_01738 TaxID=2976003 RepID=UPI002E11CC5F|nr:winged helix-turn-helix domain-containing protein [Nonomuraea sp. NBC_01738]